MALTAIRARFSIVSGGFDPIHKGHVRMISAANLHYGSVICILNSNFWLTKKKGKPFMPWDDRAEILEAVRGVHRVMSVDDSDGSVCSALRSIARKYSGCHLTFCNGGDRREDNVPEVAVCKKLGIHMAFNVGGEKIESSSRLIGASRP